MTRNNTVGPLGPMPQVPGHGGVAAYAECDAPSIKAHTAFGRTGIDLRKVAPSAYGLLLAEQGESPTFSGILPKPPVLSCLSSWLVSDRST